MIEALIVTVLVSAVVLIFAYGLQASVTTDGATNRQQRMSLALTSLSESLRQVRWLVPCPASGDFDGEPTLVAGYIAKVNSKLNLANDDPNFGVGGFSITSVSYWQPGDFTDPANPTGGVWGTTCTEHTSAVRLGFSVELGGDSMSGEIVKRDQANGRETVGATVPVVTP